MPYADIYNNFSNGKYIVRGIISCETYYLPKLDFRNGTLQPTPRTVYQWVGWNGGVPPDQLCYRAYVRSDPSALLNKGIQLVSVNNIVIPPSTQLNSNTFRVRNNVRLEDFTLVLTIV